MSVEPVRRVAPLANTARGAARFVPLQQQFLQLPELTPSGRERSGEIIVAQIQRLDVSELSQCVRQGSGQQTVNHVSPKARTVNDDIQFIQPTRPIWEVIDDDLIATVLSSTMANNDADDREV